MDFDFKAKIKSSGHKLGYGSSLDSCVIAIVK